MATPPSSVKARSRIATDSLHRSEAATALCEIDCVHVDSVRQARATLPAGEAIISLAETLKALGDPTRLRIVAALASQELCVCDIAQVLGASQSAVSHSLRSLRQLRIVRYRKAGKIAYYRLDDDHISTLLREGIRHVEELDEPRSSPGRA